MSARFDIFLLQVTPSHVCNPINHKCSCERGFTPTEDGQLGLVCRMVNEVCSLLPYGVAGTASRAASTI